MQQGTVKGTRDSGGHTKAWWVPPTGRHHIPNTLSAVLHERCAAVPEQHQAAAGLLPAPGLPAGAAPWHPCPPGAHRRWDRSPPQLFAPPRSYINPAGTDTRHVPCPHSLRRCHRCPLAPRLLRGCQPWALQGHLSEICPFFHWIQVRLCPPRPRGSLAAPQPPVGLGAAVGAMGPSLHSQQDAQEFLKFFMDRLHVEINRKGRRTPSILSDARRTPALEDPETLR